MSFVSLLASGLWIEVVLYVAARLALGSYGLRAVMRLRSEPPSLKEGTEARTDALLQQHRANERPEHRWKVTDTEDEAGGAGSYEMD